MISNRMEPEKKSHGALIGSIIIIIIIIIGGIYVWQSRVKDVETKLELQSKALDTEVANDLDLLEQDLNTTNLDLETGLDTLE